MSELTAQIILRAADGSSPLDSESPPTADEIARSRPTQETIDNATRRLTALGFKVGDMGAIALTVSADKAIFEQVFKTSLSQTTHLKSGAPHWTADPPITISDDLRSWVIDVVFPIEPEFVP